MAILQSHGHALPQGPLGNVVFILTSDVLELLLQEKLNTGGNSHTAPLEELRIYILEQNRLLLLSNSTLPYGFRISADHGCHFWEAPTGPVLGFVTSLMVGMQ